MTIVPVSSGNVALPARPADWQRELREAIRDPVQLCRHLQLPASYEPAAIRAARDFPVFAPRGYVAKIEPASPRDPLLRQILPLAQEQDAVAGFGDDPVAEAQVVFQPGVLRKYDARVLLITTGACAIHCRYCFRRHFPYQEIPPSMESWEPALRRLAEDQSIQEVILSGGDPLTVVDSRLAALVRGIAALPQVTRLRIHTRLPIVIPDRVTSELIDGLASTRLATYVVVHANHPRELDQAVLSALTRLLEGGVIVLNQSVLLRGVNDDVEVLRSLCQQLVDHRVLPYYLHQLDRVRGAAHFEVPIARGREILDKLRACLPGYAVPRYVQEQPGAASKVILA